MIKKIALLCALSLGTNIVQAQVLDKVVAIVNNGVITAAELNKQVEQSKKQLMAQRVQVPDALALRKQVLQHLIDVDLQMQVAKQNNVSVDNTELNAAIERIASSNHIELSKLREAISQEGMNWKEYRNNIRKEMILSRLQQNAVGKDVHVTNEQVEHYLKTSGAIVDYSTSIFHVQNIVVALSEEPTPAEIKKAQAKAELLLAKVKKGDDFSRLAIEESSDEVALGGGDLGERHLAELPEIFANEIVRMKAGDVAGPLRAANGFQLIKLVSIKGDQQKHIITRTHVRHILLKPDASTLPSEAMTQINNIYHQLQSGKDFALMAKQYSLDSSSAVKGGDLGWVTPGELVPEFEKTMNELTLNQISHPVKTQFGWHLIQVLAREQKDDTEAFKKQQVRQFLQQRKFTEAVQNWQQHLRAEAYVNILEKELT